MPNIREGVYEMTGTIKTNHYIETGAYLGDGIEKVLGNYPHIHSIELSEKWYDHNVQKFSGKPSVKMHLGDSKKILPELLDTIQEPVTVFLDAHYSGKLTSFGDEETPLLLELEVLKNRSFDDIIIIDDCRLLGKSGTCGCEPDHPIYPEMHYDWTNITEYDIFKLMKPGYILLRNEDGSATDGPGDQIILIKNHKN